MTEEEQPAPATDQHMTEEEQPAPATDPQTTGEEQPALETDPPTKEEQPAPATDPQTTGEEQRALETDPPTTEAQPALETAPDREVTAEAPAEAEAQPEADSEPQPQTPAGESEAEPLAEGEAMEGLPTLRPVKSTGSRGAGGNRLKLPTNPVPDLQFLTFNSWWTEFNTKRYMEVCFDMSTELFQIILDKEVRRLGNTSLLSSKGPSLFQRPTNWTGMDLIYSKIKPRRNTILCLPSAYFRTTVGLPLLKWNVCQIHNYKLAW